MAIPLQGATFELRDSNGQTLLTAVSAANGLVTMGNVGPGTYTLVETIPPPGYVGGGPYSVVVENDGRITIDGTTEMESFRAVNYQDPDVTFMKHDPIGNPLMGAEFTISDEFGSTWTGTSTIDGTVTIYGVPAGDFTMIESKAPFGYLPDPSVHQVHIGTDGTILIDGNPADEFTAVNRTGRLMRFYKDDSTPPTPPPEIDDVRAGFSTVTGTGIAGGVVTVTWPGGDTSEVTVGLDNKWSVVSPVNLAMPQVVSAVQKLAKRPVSSSVQEPVQATSDSPVIHEIYAGDSDLTGEGVDGSTITVTWPDGSTATATVAAGGAWTVSAPADLKYDDKITATQTTSPMLSSLPTETRVFDVTPQPVFDPVYVPATGISGTGIAGAHVTITWPDGTTQTTVDVGPAGTWIAAVPSSQSPLTVGDELTATQTFGGMDTSDEASIIVAAKSAPPTIDSVYAHDDIITGTGIAGSDIDVSWTDSTGSPVDAAGRSTDILRLDGSDSTIVDPDGTWTLAITDTLEEGDIVYANQTEQNKDTSDNVETTVLQERSAPPTIDPIAQGYPPLKGTGIEGSSITVIWPRGGGTEKNIPVDDQNQWSADPPIPVQQGDIIYATQTEPGKIESRKVNTTVMEPPT